MHCADLESTPQTIQENHIINNTVTGYEDGADKKSTHSKIQDQGNTVKEKQMGYGYG